MYAIGPAQAVRLAHRRRHSHRTAADADAELRLGHAAADPRAEGLAPRVRAPRAAVHRATANFTSRSRPGDGHHDQFLVTARRCDILQQLGH